MEATVPGVTAIGQLYNDYHQPIVRYLERLVNDRETAEDLCHDTFIKALRYWQHHDPLASEKSWLYRIATNTAYDYLRRRRRVTMTPLADSDVANMTMPETPIDAAEPIREALDRIPAHYRIPLMLQSYAGYTLSDIAQVLDCNVNTVKTRVHRARVQFRQHYHP